MAGTEKETEKDPTINEALNISDEWRIINEAKSIKSIEERDSISEAMLEVAARIRKECFEDDTHGISDYEKKLIYAGYMMCGSLHEMKSQAAQAALMGQLFTELLVKKKDGGDTEH